MRRLIYIRVIHNNIESSLAKKYQLDREIDRFWLIMEKEFLGMRFDLRKTRIFHDTVCGGRGIVMQAFKKIAQAGSPNARFVLRLISKGARLEMTESPKLMRFLEKYKYKQKYLSKVRDLRDQYVAKRIARVLRRGETGILIMGANHNVEDYLPKDIRVFYLRKSDSFLARLLKKNAQPA